MAYLYEGMKNPSVRLSQPNRGKKVKYIDN